MDNELMDSLRNMGLVFWFLSPFVTFPSLGIDPKHIKTSSWRYMLLSRFTFIITIIGMLYTLNGSLYAATGQPPEKAVIYGSILIASALILKLLALQLWGRNLGHQHEIRA